VFLCPSVEVTFRYIHPTSKFLDDGAAGGSIFKGLFKHELHSKIRCLFNNINDRQPRREARDFLVFVFRIVLDWHPGCR
jgi:hypothetical protein